MPSKSNKRRRVSRGKRRQQSGRGHIRIVPERREQIDHYLLARVLLRLAQAEYDAAHAPPAADGEPPPSSDDADTEHEP